MQSLRKTNILLPNNFEAWDSLMLPKGVLKLERFSFNMPDARHVCNDGTIEKRKRLYCIEMHYYDGFAMIKFYPKKSSYALDRYRQRGIDLGYQLHWVDVRRILFQCAELMKYYLDEYSHNYVGYVGQPDLIDDCRNRLKAQRSNIYDPYVAGLFKFPKYRITAPNDKLDLTNITLIQKVQDLKRPNTQSKIQITNFAAFKSVLEFNKNEIPALMTSIAREKIFGKKQNTL
jgi:hypothetical protein